MKKKKVIFLFLTLAGFRIKGKLHDVSAATPSELLLPQRRSNVTGCRYSKKELTNTLVHSTIQSLVVCLLDSAN